MGIDLIAEGVELRFGPRPVESLDAKEIVLSLLDQVDRLVDVGDKDDADHVHQRHDLNDVEIGRGKIGGPVPYP